MTYDEAYDIVKDEIKGSIPVGVYEDKDQFYFVFVPENEKKNNAKEYSGSAELSVNKKTGKIKPSQILMFCALFDPENLESIKKSYRKID